MIETISVKDFGAAGDGVADDAAAFQRALDSGAAKVTVPAGNYKIGKTLYIGSDTELSADPGTVIRLADNTVKKRGDFLITNRSYLTGGRDENVTVRGGVWDGNNLTNRKPQNLFEDGCSGAIMNFIGVSGLTLSGVTLKDSGGYFTRFGRVDGFLIEDVTFISTEFAPNNDGLHFGGFVENGVISNIRAATPGTTSDDLIALNADDIITRCEALDLECGYIRNLTFDGLYVEQCASFVRMLSIDSDITNVKISNVHGGFSCLVVNMDASRNCMTPIFDPDSERARRGIGHVENVTIEHLRAHTTTADGYFPYFILESNMKNFAIKDFVREDHLERCHVSKSVVVKNVAPSKFTFKGDPDQARELSGADGDDGSVEFNSDYYEEHVISHGGFESLVIETI